MAVVLTLVQIKHIRMIVHKGNNTKNTVQTIQNTVNESTHITKNTHPYVTRITGTLREDLCMYSYDISLNSSWSEKCFRKHTFYDQ